MSLVAFNPQPFLVFTTDEDKGPHPPFFVFDSFDQVILFLSFLSFLWEGERERLSTSSGGAERIPSRLIAIPKLRCQSVMWSLLASPGHEADSSTLLQLASGGTADTHLIFNLSNSTICPGQNAEGKTAAHADCPSIKEHRPWGAGGSGLHRGPDFPGTPCNMSRLPRTGPCWF